MKKFVFLISLLLSGFVNAKEGKALAKSKIKSEFSFKVEDAQITLPKRVEMRRNGTILFGDKDAGIWKSETDHVGYFKFGKAIFLIVSQWDTGDFISFRLFHLGSTKAQTKEYTIMGAVEDDNGAVFFESEAKLYYWERFFCRQKMTYVFDEKKLDFVEVHFNDLKEEDCLPEKLSSASKTNKVERIPVQGKH